MSQMPTPPGFPQPPAINSNSGELDADESKFILDTTLRAKHRADPSVLAFIDEFIRCKNIAEASAAVGIKPSIGYQYRHRQDIASAIQKLIDRSAIKYGFDASEIIERTKEIVDFDPISMQNADGTFKSKLYDIDPAARRNLKKLKVKNLYQDIEDINGIKSKIIVGEIIEYEFYDKLKAIDLLGAEKDVFKKTTRVEHTVTKDMASILLASAERGRQATVTYAPPVTVDAEVVEETEESDD